MSKNIFAFLVSLALCFAAAAVGWFATNPSIPTFYAGLNKPFFNPPNWIFGPVWAILYILMAVSAFLVWRKKGLDPALGIFLLQLAVNSFWSIVFFSWHSPPLAFKVLLILWLTVAWTILSFYAILPLAGWLLVPYLLWVSFAAVLNLAIVILNP